LKILISDSTFADLEAIREYYIEEEEKRVRSCLLPFPAVNLNIL